MLVWLSSAATARAEDLVLGMSAAFTGATSALGIECYRGAWTCFQEINDKGGIRGRKVVIRARDDGYDPVKALLNTEKLIREDKVLALFAYVGTPTTTRVLPLLKRYEEEYWQLFFPFTGADILREQPYDAFVYNLRASYRQETKALVDYFVKHGRRRIAVFYQIDVYGRTGWDGVRQALKKNGLNIISEATYKRGTKFEANFHEQVDELRQNEPDAIISIGSYGACAAFIRDARNAGLKAPIGNLSFVGSEQLLGLLRQAGREANHDYTADLIVSQVVPSYFDDSLPAAREYRAAMDQYRPPLPEIHEPGYQPLQYGFVSFEGYLDAKVMAEILHRAGNNPDRRALREAADSLKRFPIGLGPDVTVSLGPGPFRGLNKVYLTVIRDGKFVALADE